MKIFRYGRAEFEYLKRKDKKLGLAMERIGMIERTVIPDPFTALVNSVVCQQISVKAARTIWKRMLEYWGTISPGTLASATTTEIQQFGLSMRKAGYIRGIGEAVAQGKLNISELPELPDDEVIRRLSALHGIGVWTAEMLLIFSLERPNVLSWGDLGIQRGMMSLYHHEKLDRARFERYRKRYSPYGSVASLYLWKVAAER
jgi:DNA-3-methyladenine glycosylase II